MKIVIINKSDSTGGAAIVSRRLMEALRQEGHDARMLVCEKLSDSPFVEVAAPLYAIKKKFYLERLKIFFANGFNRATLFKIDTGEVGLPLWRHPLVKNADAILLNWVNQGMLSLKGVKKILSFGKPVVWTMHDMWEMTGICHHAGICTHFHKECGNCPLLNEKRGVNDLSRKIWEKKRVLYSSCLGSKLAFVSVSRWLRKRAQLSSLLSEWDVEVIPNAFQPNGVFSPSQKAGGKIRILMGAARLDDPIKGLDTLKEALNIIKRDNPHLASHFELALFGIVKDEKRLTGFGLPIVRLGCLNGEDELKKAYESSQILVSASSYETFACTLVEGQAYGCIPVSFNQGGQTDIIEHKETGYLADYDETLEKRAANLAEGLLWAAGIVKEASAFEKIRVKMRESVEKKFSYKKVANAYISLIQKLSLT